MNSNMASAQAVCLLSGRKLPDATPGWQTYRGPYTDAIFTVCHTWKQVFPYALNHDLLINMLFADYKAELHRRMPFSRICVDLLT